MGYVTNRRGIYRTGFRPINATDTFAAAQLDGFSSASPLGRTPFDPERLGQYHPFTPGGGWRLSGLGDIVPDQAVITYTGTWMETSTESMTQILQAVSAALGQDGFRVLKSQIVNAGFVAKTGLWTAPFQVALQLLVNNGMGFSDPSDIASIVDHEVYAASGMMPSASQAVVTQLPAGSTSGGGPYAYGDFGTQATPSTGTDWNAVLQGYAPWIVLGILGAVVIRRFL